MRAADPNQPTALLRELFAAAVQRALPLQHTAAALPPPPRGRTLVLGAGKAAAAMAQAVEALWPSEAALSGLVVTRYGHTPARPAGLAQRIEVLQAAHPLPDAAGLDAARRVLALSAGLSADDLVLCLMSGGGSALLTLPCAGLTLADLQRINQRLLHCGAPIGDINTVRKHLCRLKGGQLARACAPARVVTLAISDVPGDDLSLIASGPSVADPSWCADALAVLQRYQIELPAAVLAQLHSGALETPKPGDPLLRGHTAHLIATPAQSLQAAAQIARAHGLHAYVLSDEIEGEAREVAKVHAALARSAARGRSSFQTPCVLLSGGETTVTLAPPPGLSLGQGGRAGEFCLALTQALAGHTGVWALAADTDGIDGACDSAGALVRPDTLARAQALGLHLPDFLQRHDACGFFAPLGDLLCTGPTFTNVNDFRALLVR